MLCSFPADMRAAVWMRAGRVNVALLAPRAQEPALHRPAPQRPQRSAFNIALFAARCAVACPLPIWYRGFAARPTTMTGPTAPHLSSTESSASGTSGQTCDSDDLQPHAALNLVAAVFRFAQTQPSAPALVVEERSYSYAELAQAAANVAAWIRSLPTAADGSRRIGILASRSFDTYAGILGAAWAAATYVPLNPQQPTSRLASVLGQARLHALLVDAGASPKLQSEVVRAAAPAHVLVRPTAADAQTVANPNTSSWDALAPANPSAGPAPVRSDHPGYVIFTSGTTGVPKGVVVSAGSLAAFLKTIREVYAIGPGDRVGQFCATSFDLSVFELFAAWDGGACLHVIPESRLLAPARFIREHELTVWSSVPSVISILQRMKLLRPGSFPSLRLSFFIGEALPTSAAQAWQAAAPNSVVDNHYGPTEATVACTMQRLLDPPVETPNRATLAIGRAYAGMETGIVDAAGSFLPDGQTGELALHGAQVATGYLHDSEQTERRFPVLRHPELGATRWYLTGDLAYRDTDGILHCLGRLDHQVKINGHRVELEDLEAHLRSASGTAEVAAIAWPVRDGHASGIVAFVVRPDVAVGEIRDRLRELVPPYMVPRRILDVDVLPLSVNGKVDRKALQVLVEGQP